jgi:hypothetical protein
MILEVCTGYTYVPMYLCMYYYVCTTSSLLVCRLSAVMLLRRLHIYTYTLMCDIISKVLGIDLTENLSCQIAALLRLLVKSLLFISSDTNYDLFFYAAENSLWSFS